MSQYEKVVNKIFEKLEEKPQVDIAAIGSYIALNFHWDNVEELERKLKEEGYGKAFREKMISIAKQVQEYREKKG